MNIFGKSVGQHFDFSEVGGDEARLVRAHRGLVGRRGHQESFQSCGKFGRFQSFKVIENCFKTKIRRMAERGSLTGLEVTMRFPPSSLKLKGELAIKNAAVNKDFFENG